MFSLNKSVLLACRSADMVLMGPFKCENAHVKDNENRGKVKDHAVTTRPQSFSDITNYIG